MDNTKLVAHLRARYERVAGTDPMLAQAADALEAAEAELTRRDTVIAATVKPREIATDALTGFAPGTDIDRDDVWQLIVGVVESLAAAPVSLEAVKAETTEWEYGVKDYRAPGYMIIGDQPLPTADRVGYYGTRPLIRRRKAGPWKEVEDEPHV